jgi:hypothetical protein
MGKAAFVHDHSKVSKSYSFSSVTWAGGSPASRRQCPFSSTTLTHVCISKQECRGCSNAAAESNLVSLNDSRSPGPSPLHAPCRRCFDVTTSCPGLGANEICCLGIFCQQQSAADNEHLSALSPTLTEILLSSRPDISLFLITLTEHQNMINMKLQTVSLLGIINSTRSHVAARLGDDLIKQHWGEEISGLQFVSKVSYRYKTDWHVRNIPSKLLDRALWHAPAQCKMDLRGVKWFRAVWHGLAQFEMVLLSVKCFRAVWNGPARLDFSVENAAGSCNFPSTEFYCTIQVTKANVCSFPIFIINIPIMHITKKLSKFRAVVRSCRMFW